MCEMGQVPGLHRPRTKYLDIEKANLTYRKQRKHSKSQTRKITRRQLQLLDKILEEIRKMEREHEGSADLLTVRQAKDLEIVTAMYRQQHNHFSSNDHRERISNRIVSINKPYMRPIVRGKEVKSVEFGAKCNNILVDGLSFIEKLSFNAFNEGTRLVHCTKLHKRLFGVYVKKIGGDTGYAGSDNRDFCKENGIQTSFAKRGCQAAEKEEKDIVRQELARVRATRMEGSFGTLNVRSGNMQGRSHRSAQIQNIKRQSLNRRCAVIRVCLVHYSNNLRQLAILSFYKTKHKTIPGNVC